MVQQYCWVFTFIVFVGNGWLALVTAHLPHLRLLSLKKCYRVCDEYVAELMAAVPELVVINCSGEVVGGMGSKQLEAAYKCSKSEKYDIITNHYGYTPSVRYNIIRQWALDK
jgi:hypothetical protein